MHTPKHDKQTKPEDRNEQLRRRANPKNHVRRDSKGRLLNIGSGRPRVSRDGPTGEIIERPNKQNA